MVRRVACISLHDIRVELAREHEGSAELAVIVARSDRHGSAPAGPGSRGTGVQTERDVLGNTRIDFVSTEAKALGVRAGQTVAAARAKCAALRVRVIAEGAVSSALARVAEASLAFGPTTSFDVAQDIVWVDVTGCAHLRGGEAELARALAAKVHSLGHGCRVAVADGPRLAAAFARFSGSAAAETIVVPHARGADKAVRALPIEALGLEPETLRWLAELGLSTCGDLQKLPRRALGTRLGERTHDVMKLLDGQDATPLVAWRPPEIPEERHEFDWGVHSIEGLSFVLPRLCERLAARLEGRAMAAASLEIVLTLDRALCRDDSAGAHRPVLSISLPSPIAGAADLFAVVRARIERSTLPAPALAVTLRTPELARMPARTADLFVKEPKAEQALPRLVAELIAEIGGDGIGTLSLVDTWSPHERTRLLPFGMPGMPPLRARSVPVTSALEPSRLVPARPVSRDALASARHLVRVERVEWWCAPRGAGRRGEEEREVRRDLFAAWVDGALSWLELAEGMPPDPMRDERLHDGPDPTNPLLLRGLMD